MDPLERIEEQVVLASLLVRWREQLHAPVLLLEDLPQRDRGTRHVARHALQGLLLRRLDPVAGVDGEARVLPGQQGLMERLRQALSAPQAGQHESSKPLLDCLRVHAIEWMELAAALNEPIGHEGVDVRLEIRKTPERLDRRDHPRKGLLQTEHALEVAAGRVVGRARQDPQ